MIAGRTLQGFAMGALPLGIGLMRDTLPRERLGSAIAVMSSSPGVGGGLVLPAAALVAQHADRHALFHSAAVLGILSALLVLAAVPESPNCGCPPRPATASGSRCSPRACSWPRSG